MPIVRRENCWKIFCVSTSVSEKNRPPVGCEWYQPMMFPLILPDKMSSAIFASVDGSNCTRVGSPENSPLTAFSMMIVSFSSLPRSSPIISFSVPRESCIIRSFTGSQMLT